jgi:flavocytochrome c
LKKSLQWVAGILLVAIILVLSGCSGTDEGGETDVAAEEDARAASEEIIEETADVVIIGAGGAGMTAAYEVAKAGGTTIVIDKNGFIGGNTLLAGSAMNAPYEEKQDEMTMGESERERIDEALALEPENELMEQWQNDVATDMEAYDAEEATYLYDSPSWHKLQTYIGGDYVANPELIDVFGDEATASVNFLSELGAQWQDGLTSAVGSTWTRSHNPTQDLGPNGSSFVLPQTQAFEEMGGEVYLNHKAEELVTDGGRVVGVKGIANEDQEFEFTAEKGVIIATGGFGANVEMREKYNEHWPTLDASIPTSNGTWATGDGIVMAEEVNANLVGMEWIQLIPSGFGFSASISNTIFVDGEGNRFINEDARRDELSTAAMNLPDQEFYGISDAHVVVDELDGVSSSGETIDEIVDDETVFKADSIEELAEKMGINPESLVATVDAYNESVETRQDEFNRQVFDNKIDKAPFYARRGRVVVHHTMGGLEINDKTEVIDSEGNPIPGLYAAGEVTGGIHGANRLGGNAITDVTTFGRIAGQTVME